MGRNHTIVLAKWKCELCSGEGRDFLPKWKARRSYRLHVNREHNGVPIQPNFEYKRIEGGKNEEKEKAGKRNKRDR